MPVTEQQRRAIVYLAKAARDQLHGAANWDEHGIDAAVAKVAHLHLVDVATAAMRAADDRDLKTPGAIGNPQAPCWAERRTDRPQPMSYDQGPLCGWCALPEGDVRARHGDDHDFISKADWDQRLATEGPRRRAREGDQ